MKNRKGALFIDFKDGITDEDMQKMVVALYEAHEDIIGGASFYCDDIELIERAEKTLPNSYLGDEKREKRVKK